MSEFNLKDWPVRVISAAAMQKQKHGIADWYSKIWPDYSDWCNQTYGHGNWEYYYGQFLFKREKDATMFRLRWPS